MNIKEYISSGILEAYALDGLSAQEAREVEDMLSQYSELREELAQIEESLELVSMEMAVAPPANLKSSILGAIDEPSQKKEAPSMKVEAKEEEDQKVVPIQKKGISPWSYVAAASIALTLFSSYMAYDYYNKWQSTAGAYAQLQASNQLMAEQYDQVNQRLDQLSEDVDVISNADFNRINMGSVVEGQSFAASVYWNAKTEEAYLNIEQLKALSEDQQYQLWAIVDGVPVDMGVFDYDTDGLLKMKSVSGNAATFAVTIEPRGGSESPTLDLMQVAGNV